MIIVTILKLGLILFRATVIWLISVSYAIDVKITKIGYLTWDMWLTGSWKGTLFAHFERPEVRTWDFAYLLWAYLLFLCMHAIHTDSQTGLISFPQPLTQKVISEWSKIMTGSKYSIIIILTIFVSINWQIKQNISHNKVLNGILTSNKTPT